MIRIELKSSRILAAILTAAHAAAAVLVMLLAVPLVLKLTAIAALAASLAWTVRKNALLRSCGSVTGIEIASDDTLSVRRRTGDWVPCAALGTTYVAGFVVILNVKELEGRRVQHAVVLPDSIDAEDFRRLRVWLRWKRGAVTNSSGALVS